MTLLRTPLHDAHRKLGGRLVEFGGWEMPVQYEGVVAEHEAVRTSAGVFDVSHMGEFHVEGEGAEALLQRLTPNDVAKLALGRAHYTSFLTERGTFVDDLLLYRLGASRFMIVANGSNVAKDFSWLMAWRQRLVNEVAPVEARDVSSEMALLAVQGPRALEIVDGAYEGAVRPSVLKYYGFTEGGSFAGHPVRVLSRTGYTGEDGFEIYLDNAHAEPCWDEIIRRGAKPAGLGARDTLRLEAGMALYGNDIDETTTPIEAGLEWTVKAAKGPFTGRDVLVAQIERGTERKLVGLDVVGKGIARHDHAVIADGRVVGRVTSGTHSPTLGHAIAMAYVPAGMAAPGTAVEVDVRGRRVEARVRALPFYSRRKH